MIFNTNKLNEIELQYPIKNLFHKYFRQISKIIFILRNHSHFKLSEKDS